MIIIKLSLFSLFINFNYVVCEEKCPKDYNYCGVNDLVKCVAKEWWCDGHRDCDSGLDEANCPDSVCHASEIQCKLGTQCISKFLKCDGIAQCMDRSDEEDCVKSEKKACDILLEFDCNGDGHECIPLNQVCDGRNDCGRNQDEEPGGSASNCQRNECRLTDNGGCSHNCTNLYTKIICHCPIGFRLMNDSKTCVDIDECSLYPPRCSQTCTNTIGGYHCSCTAGYMLNGKVAGECIAKDGDRCVLITLNDGQIITLDLESNINIVHNVTSPANSWSNIDVDVGSSPDRTTIYWSQVQNQNVGETIFKRKYGSSDRFDIISQHSIYQLHNGSFCAGLSFDWLRSLLFWTSTENPRIYVTNTTSNKTSVLLSAGLQNPRAIAVDPFETRLYWIEWGDKLTTPRIETMLMNTIDRRVILKKGLRKPQGLSIDFLDQRLYWSDIKPGSIYFINLKKPFERKTVISNELLHPFSLSIFENKIFWSDWRHNQIISVDKTVGDKMTIISKISKPMSIQILNRLSKPLLSSVNATAHTCLSSESHPCPDICIPSPPTNQYQSSTVKCLCSEGTSMSINKQSCFISTESLVLPNNVNRFKIITSVIISLVAIIVLSTVIILMYQCRDRLCTRSCKSMSRQGFKHNIVTGDLMYIFKCQSHSSQLSELLSSDFNSVSTA